MSVHNPKPVLCSIRDLVIPDGTLASLSLKIQDLIRQLDQAHKQGKVVQVLKETEGHSYLLVNNRPAKAEAEFSKVVEQLMQSGKPGPIISVKMPIMPLRAPGDWMSASKVAAWLRQCLRLIERLPKLGFEFSPVGLQKQPNVVLWDRKDVPAMSQSQYKKLPYSWDRSANPDRDGWIQSVTERGGYRLVMITVSDKEPSRPVTVGAVDRNDRLVELAPRAVAEWLIKPLRTNSVQIYLYKAGVIAMSGRLNRSVPNIVHCEEFFKQWRWLLP